MHFFHTSVLSTDHFLIVVGVSSFSDLKTNRSGKKERKKEFYVKRRKSYIVTLKLIVKSHPESTWSGSHRLLVHVL